MAFILQYSNCHVGEILTIFVDLEKIPIWKFWAPNSNLYRVRGYSPKAFSEEGNEAMREKKNQRQSKLQTRSILCTASIRPLRVPLAEIES